MCHRWRRLNVDTDTVRKGAKRLNNILARTAKFFNVSMKRWAGMRKVGKKISFHINHGQTTRTLAGDKAYRLSKYRCLQKTCFVKWKGRVAYIRLNNCPTLQRFLQDTSLFTTKTTRKQAQALLYRFQELFIIGGMQMCKAWDAVLSTLSRCTQANWALLPTLYHTVIIAERRVQKLTGIIEHIIVDVVLQHGKYKGLKVNGTPEDL